MDNQPPEQDKSNPPLEGTSGEGSSEEIINQTTVNDQTQSAIHPLGDNSKTEENQLALEEITTFQVVFYLLTQHFHAEKVTIQFEKFNCQLDFVKRAGEGDLWQKICKFKIHEIYYRYHVSCQSWIWRTEAIAEVDQRIVEAPGVQYDTFCSPNDNNYFDKSIPESSIFYITWLFHDITYSNIKKILIHMEKMDLRCARKRLNSNVAWALERARSRSVTDPQRLYLCIYLGHLAITNPRIFSLPTGKLARESSDWLLQSLEMCSRLDLLTNSSLKVVETLASHLVFSSSYPGWLTFAAYFYPYIGVENVMRQRINVHEKCDTRTFWKLVALLLPVLRINEETLNVHRDLLRQLLITAPDCEAVSILYSSGDLNSFFTSVTDADDFFVKFFQDSFQNRSGNVNPNESIMDLKVIPKELLVKMHKTVYTLLIDFSKSSSEPKAVHIEAFCTLVTHSCFLSPKEFESILGVLSSSKVPILHGLLLDLLDNKKYKSYWQELSFQRKVDICVVWVLTMLKENRSKRNAAKKISSVYQAVQQLMFCSFNDADKSSLAKKICKRIFNEDLKSVESGAFLMAYKSIEQYNEIIQLCYKNHIRDLLLRDPSLIRNAIAEAVDRRGLSSSSVPTLSSLAQDVCLYVLEVIGTLELKDDADGEKEFREMSEYSDIWITLLRARGCVKKLHNDCRFKVGKQKWEVLACRIKNGNLSTEDLFTIEERIEIISFISAIVTTEPHITEDELLKEKQVFATRIFNLAKAQRNCSEKFELLKSVIDYAIKVSEDICIIPGQDDLISAFNQCRDKWQTQERLDEWDNDSWGIMFPLLRPAKTLKPLINSESFMNFAKICLEESLADSSVVEDEECETHNFRFLLQFLTNTVVERFSSQWNPVFSDPGALTVKTVKNLLKGLDSEENLEKEFVFLGNHFRREFSSDMKRYIKCYVKYPHVLDQVKLLFALLDTFQLNDPSHDKLCSTLKSFESLEDDNELTLEMLRESMCSIQEVVTDISEDEIEAVIEELGRSNDLVDLVEEIGVNEDIRFLIDAVEDHSDQFVSGSSVSNLIDVHGFLAPLIKKSRKGCKVQQFLSMLKQSSYQDMAVKIRECSANVNTLKALYNGVANREEITKEIISSCLKEGTYLVSVTSDGVHEVQMSYARNDQKSANYSLSDLHDLRSRAHLIANSDKKAPLATEKNADIDFSEFINQINLLTDITTLLSKLHSSGYVKYRKFWERMKGTSTLQAKKDVLEKELEVWENILSSAREQFYFLNYYRSDQLCVLHDFLSSRTSHVKLEDVLPLIHFVDPSITNEKLEVHRKTCQISQQAMSSSDPREIISIIGYAFEKVFAETNPVVRSIFKPTNDVEDSTSSFASQIHATVRPGELFVANLEEKSQLTANVILTLYENTSDAFPEPYQVVFCTPQTTWEEIHLILQRCFAQSEKLKYYSLFCIANVELLANEIQFKLVNAIKEVQNDDCGLKQLERRREYRLALICRGGDHHHIVEQFSQYAYHIAGMSDSTLSERLVSAWPEVSMITSALPGLGKTERIKKEAIKKSKNIVTFPISGPLDHTKLVQRLKGLKLKKYHCLHLDVGNVNDPLQLDTFLFQLIVIGMVSSGTEFYHLPTKHVFIEVANTLDDYLRDSLMICKYFTRIHLKWRHYEDLVISSEITSNIQVVCQYFDALDRACLESKDIHFTGPKKVKPLPVNRCRKLLANHFSSNTDITFTVLNTFLAVLADQLLKFSRSAFFKIAHLKSMLGDETNGVRTTLFQALVNVSKEFASRSIATYHSSDSDALSLKESAEALDKAMTINVMSAQNMVERADRMIQWEDSNHLLVVFHGISSQTITAVYRNKALVPLKVEKLLTSQVVKRKKKALEDFKVMSQHQLQEKLEKIVCNKLVKKDETNPANSCSYALTPDNILKMILIILRVRANAPIIIMGETGCGKTSLIRYLANTCQIPFVYFNFHAGVNVEELVDFIEHKEKQVIGQRQKMWVFLDEINTCDHLGLINDIVCHHMLLGRPLSTNLVFLAACNPYKLRPNEHIRTAGLEGRNIADEFSKLVYRVHPLPEAMLDYVWDFGSLAPKDEKAYIERMAKALPDKFEGLLADLLAESQRFIRKAEKNHYCVSLRDVYRCIHLTKWFMETIKERGRGKESRADYHHNQGHLNKYRWLSQKYDNEPMVKSIVLALAHCYQSRLPTADLRREYRQRMMKLFSSKGTIMDVDGKIDHFSAIVRMEEEDYLNRMELPPGTAKNAALRENVFVMLVCILNRMPVFVVGKPGCSKSLSIQLIRSNLRGRDSRDEFFRKLPHLYLVSYQGSESSTSEGIIKVFEKARKLKSDNQGKNVLPVVLLDEVGLAENSKYNPLKVLHSLLEPEDGQLLDIAVVGISNWSLDAAKMNRAIHLSRPDPNEDDLYETGQSLYHADFTEKRNWKHSMNNILQYLAKGYFEYQSKQRYPNFHGLRDYYSLIKSLIRRGGNDLQQINMSLQRNFGGIPGELTNIQKMFLDQLKKGTMLNISSGDGVVSVNKLIQENLADPLARHLMLITSGDSAIGILKQNLAELNREAIVIFGSRFEEDISEEYNYRMLSRIILCMERNCILILQDLDSIYGSLYDMLNQNYAVVGKKKNCRVALGAHGNPMCQVNDHFRCIVLTDRQKVNSSDPPFLNRFEKQLLRFSDVLDARQHGIIDLLGKWVQQISTIQDHESHFNETDMFIGYHEDTLPSLVLLHGQNPKDTNEIIIQKCKDELMWIAAPDAVLRAHISARVANDSREVNKLSEEYFQKPIHSGLATFIEASTNEESPVVLGDEIGIKTIVMTFSNIHTNILTCMGDNVKCHVERLAGYKSEKQFAERIDEYFKVTSEAELLVLQCKPELDAEHILLARSIIEEKRTAYKHTYQKTEEDRIKHVCIIMHVQREATTKLTWQFSFLCGWKQVFLDVLEAPLVPLNEVLSRSIPDLLTSTIWPIRKIAQDVILWCFTCIKYKRQQRSLNSILDIVKNLFESKKVYKAIKKLVIQWINAHDEKQDAMTGFSERWQVKIACDRQALVNYSTLYSAMEQYASQLVRQPLAKIIYFLEKENAWPLHVFSQLDDGISKTTYEEMWCKLVLQDDIFKLADIPEPLGAESYTLDGVNLELHLPFSQMVIGRIDGVKELFLQDYGRLKENENNVDETGQLIPSIQLQQMNRYYGIFSRHVQIIGELPPSSFSSYMNDLFDLTSKDFNSNMDRQQRVSIIKAAYVSHVMQLSAQGENALHYYVQLHAFVWIHKEQILDLLSMVVSCLSFVHQNVSELMTDEFLSSHPDVLMHSKDNDAATISSEKAKSDEKDSLEGNGEALPGLELQDDITAEGNNNSILVKHYEAGNEAAEKGDGIEDDESCEGNNDIEQESFVDTLVTAYCEKMLPSQDTVEKENGGLKSWMRNSCLLLSLASKISDQTTAFHFLKLSVDLARILLSLPTAGKKIDLYPLRILNEIGVSLEPEYLDAEECFEKINEELINHLQKEVKPKFSALFFGRCIDTNADTYSVPTIVEHVLSLDQADMVLMMGPVMLRLLMIEESESPGIFTDIISKPSIIKDHPCLKVIDQEFKILSSRGKINCDSYAAVMICDLIQSLLNLDDHLSIEDFNSSDSKLLICLNDAANILSDAESKNCGLNVLSAAAFLRWFFSFLSRFIAKNAVNVLKYESVYAVLMKDINSILTTVVRDDDRRSSLQLFFLKQLRQHKRLFDLRKLCCESEMLPALKTLWISKESVGKAKFVSSCKLDEYQQVKSAYWKLSRTDSEELEMVAFLVKCHLSSNHRLALLGILVNMIYLKRAERKLTDNEEFLVRWFGEKFEQFRSPLKDLLLRIIGLKDFKSSHLQVSPESSVDEVETALLILHISGVISSGIEDVVTSPLCQYFTNVLECQNTFILALGEERKHQSLEIREVSSCPSPFTCTCGLRSKFKNDHQDNRCVNCNETHQLGTKSSDSSGNLEGNTSSIKGFSSVPRQESSQSEWTTCMDHMDPSVFRALHMIVHASLYAGVAVELTTIPDLSLVLRLGKDKSSSEADDDCPDPQQFLFKQVADDLQNLAGILDCKRETVLSVMHLVVERCTDLIRGSVNGNACSSEKERVKWEIEFSNTAGTFLKKALAPAVGLKKFTRTQQQLESQCNSLVDKIEELDEYSSDPDKQNRQLKRLFRVTKQPTFEDFRANYINRPKHFQERHRFLSIFFGIFDKLPVISNLYHLLKWARLVSSTLSHRISRKEAHSISVNDFIHGQLNNLNFNRTKDEMERLNELFKNFEEAWNNVHRLVNQNLDSEVKEMPWLTEDSEIAYCLVETDCGVYLHTAFKILTSLQNTILDELIILSAVHHHPALYFLEKNASCSGIPSVSLQEAKEKDIISLQWSKLPNNNAEYGKGDTIHHEMSDEVLWCDKVFKYAQSNPEYSKGDEIHYDFEQIEIILANGLAFGKCHLTVSFNKFIFAKEFFHSCGPLLSEIRELCPQSSSLPDDVRQGLASLQECRKKQAQDLLQQIEVLIFLLKRVNKCDVDTTLELFANEWLSMLPSPFSASLLPQPSNSIKLKHITALYEAIEDILADGAIKGIPDQFRADLTEKLKDRLEGLKDRSDKLVDNGNKLSIQVFINVLRRFVFRYLSSEKFLPEPNTTLSSCLQEPSLWSSCTKPDLDVIIPKDLTVAYIHSTITHLQNLEKERKNNTKQLAQRPGSRNQIVKTGRRRTMKF